MPGVQPIVSNRNQWPANGSNGGRTTSKVRTAYHFFFDSETSPGSKKKLNGHTTSNDVLRYVCGWALPQLVSNILRLEINFFIDESSFETPTY